MNLQKVQNISTNIAVIGVMSSVILTLFWYLMSLPVSHGYPLSFNDKSFLLLVIVIIFVGALLNGLLASICNVILTWKTQPLKRAKALFIFALVSGCISSFFWSLNQYFIFLGSS